MDTYNVDTTEQYLQVLEQQKSVLRAAKRSQGQKVQRLRSPSELVTEFMTRFHQQRSWGTGKGRMIRSSFLPHPYTPCIEPLDKLSPIFILDLRLETHHRGRYLLLRSLTPPNRMTAVMCIVEDEKGSATMLQLYQLDNKPDWPSEGALEKNDVLIVKEPFFKKTADGNLSLRVDHVSDVIKLDGSKIPSQWSTKTLDTDKSAEQWKLKGNENLRIGRYWHAVQDYNAGLRRTISTAEDFIIKRNRALAYLRNGCFDAALEDAAGSDDQSSAAEKSQYRVTQALYSLERFEECHAILTSLCDTFPDNAEAAKQLKRVVQRLEEQKSADYDFKGMNEKACYLRPPYMDHATFVGPITVKNTDGRGRGTFTTKNVKAGDLLLCEKAFAHCFAKSEGAEEAEGAETSILINLETESITQGTQASLITTVVQKLRRNPSLLKPFVDLHHGKYSPVNINEVDGKPVIDTFLVGHIISNNVFGSPPSTLEKHKNNAAHDMENEAFQSTGIWLQASLINHSCQSTVRRSFVGDMMLVRATRDMPAGTELLWWYRMPNEKDKQKTLQRMWGFECICTMCKDQQSTPSKTLKRRAALASDLNSLLKPFQPPNNPQNILHLDIARTRRLLAALETTYKAPVAEIPRLELWDFHVAITRLEAQKNNPEGVISSSLAALRTLGFVITGADGPFSPSQPPFRIEQWGLMHDGAVEILVHLWTSYACVAPQMCKAAEEAAKTAFTICVGWGEEFDEVVGKGAREAIAGL